MKTTTTFFSEIDSLDDQELKKNILIYQIIENLSTYFNQNKIEMVKKVKSFFPEWSGNMIEFFRSKNYALLYKFNTEIK